MVFPQPERQTYTAALRPHSRRCAASEGNEEAPEQHTAPPIIVPIMALEKKPGVNLNAMIVINTADPVAIADLSELGAPLS